MNKEELIHIHTLMVLVKDFFEKRGKGEFSKYYSLQISPIHVHRHKDEHKNAIFVLGKEILSVINADSSMKIYDPNLMYDPDMKIYDSNLIYDGSNLNEYDPNLKVYSNTIIKNRR